MIEQFPFPEPFPRPIDRFEQSVRDEIEAAQAQDPHARDQLAARLWSEATRTQKDQLRQSIGAGVYEAEESTRMLRLQLIKNYIDSEAEKRRDAFLNGIGKTAIDPSEQND